jgi:hypothetical protein
MPLSQEGFGDERDPSGQHVNRMIAELKREGLIVMSGSEVKILDRAALQILGEFRPADLGRMPIRNADARRVTSAEPFSSRTLR